MIGAGIHRQAMRAIDEADALLLVVDGRAGVSAIDHELATQLRATGKPRVPRGQQDRSPDERSTSFTTSTSSASATRSRSRRRTAAASTRCSRRSPTPCCPVPSREPDEDDERDRDCSTMPDDGGAEATRTRPSAKRRAPTGPLRVAFVGRPNAGKSSLTNRLLGEERSLVHDVAGTTTDPVDAPFSIGGRDYVLVDTAGIRRKAKIDADIEKIAVSMALGQIERADVAVLVIDAGIGPAEQDARIAGKIEEAGRALVIALNKSDLVSGEAKKSALRELTKDTFHFLDVGADRDAVGPARRRRRSPARSRRSGREGAPPAHPDRAAQPLLRRGDRGDAAAAPSRPRDHASTTSRRRAMRPPTFVLWANTARGPRAELQAVHREPAARGLRLPRHADPHLRQGAQGPSRPDD